MERTRWAKVKGLIDQAYHLEARQRAALLSEACADDPSLRLEVESIIASAKAAPDLFATPISDLVVASADHARSEALVGSHVGRYTLIERIASGGMGTVYLAERADGQFDQRVAFKLINGQVVTDEMVRRFRAERQTLANLSHPNIAKLLDGGTTNEGVPYLVMEYVDGQPIDRYCDRNKLSTAQRLELFRAVCAAVQYAHQNLVIHRDLKPANILVDGHGMPKLLDFGIAKVLDPSPSDAPPNTTLTLQRLLTPQYASPEHIRGEPVTVATDVYSLGVILYELLTGHRPYRVTGRGAVDIERAICDQDPIKPSTVIQRVEQVAPVDGTQGAEITPATVAAARGVQPEKLRRRLEGDIDTMVLMAMRKEPARRYASAAEFSQDIRRHLDRLPVAARRDTRVYRTGKFIRRHTLVASILVALALSLVGGIVGTTWQARVARRQRDAALEARRSALTEAARAERVVEFLKTVFASVNPANAQGHEMTVREALDEAAERIDADLRREPRIAAAVHATLGTTYVSLGLLDKAGPHLQKALRLRRDALGNDHPEVAKSLKELATLDYQRGRYDEAEPLLREALRLERSRFGNRHPDVAATLNDLAAVQRAAGNLTDAESHCRDALDIRKETLGDEHPDVAVSLNNLAGIRMAHGDHAAAEPLLREALSIRSSALGVDHPDTAQALNNLAVALTRMRRFDEAASVLSDALATYRRILSPDHPVLNSTLGNLCALYIMTHRDAEAEPLLHEVLARQRERLGSHHPSVAGTLWNLAACYREMGRHLDAEPLLRQCLDIRRAQLPVDDTRTITTMNELGRCLMRLHRYADAEPLLVSSHAQLKKKFGDGDDRTKQAAQWVADLRHASDRSTNDSL